ncbi:hypothetical protein TNCV_1178651 [Trichonephila clavipes]|nr:hypothetical protein TNCV_1178651 [Trichonephila clavipes]
MVNQNLPSNWLIIPKLRIVKRNDNCVESCQAYKASDRARRTGFICRYAIVEKLFGCILLSSLLIRIPTDFKVCITKVGNGLVNPWNPFLIRSNSRNSDTSSSVSPYTLIRVPTLQASKLKISCGDRSGFLASPSRVKGRGRPVRHGHDIFHMYTVLQRQLLLHHSHPIEKVGYNSAFLKHGLNIGKGSYTFSI